MSSLSAGGSWLCQSMVWACLTRSSVSLMKARLLKNELTPGAARMTASAAAEPAMATRIIHWRRTSPALRAAMLPSGKTTFMKTSWRKKLFDSTTCCTAVSGGRMPMAAPMRPRTRLSGRPSWVPLVK